MSDPTRAWRLPFNKGWTRHIEGPRDRLVRLRRKGSARARSIVLLVAMSSWLGFAASTNLYATSLKPEGLPAAGTFPPTSEMRPALNAAAADRPLWPSADDVEDVLLPALAGMDLGGGVGLLKPWPYQDSEESSVAGVRSLRGAMVGRSDMPAAALHGIASVHQEIRYEMPEAGEVFMLWGINNWHVAPEAARPSGTVLNGEFMYTPMVREGESFVMGVTVAPGTIIDYCFHITKKRNGSKADVWDTNGYPPRNYQTVAGPRGARTILGTLNLEKAPTGRPHAPLVTQEIRYQAAEILEMVLVWGINGWDLVPEIIRPLGTVVKNTVMHTPMMRDGDGFVAKIRVPAGATVDYGFLVTTIQNGQKTQVWRANGPEDFHLAASRDGQSMVSSQKAQAP